MYNIKIVTDMVELKKKKKDLERTQGCNLSSVFSVMNTVSYYTQENMVTSFISVKV